MTAMSDFERQLGSVLEADGPADVPEAFIEAALGQARGVRQRRPMVGALDRRAWPTYRWAQVLQPSRAMALTLLALLLAILAAALVGGRLERLTKPDILGTFDGILEPIGRLGGVRHDPALVALLDGRVLIVGGSDVGMPAEIVDPTTGRTMVVGADDSGDPSGPVRAVRLLDGRVLVVGWTYEVPGPGGRPDIRLFDPSTDTFSTVGPMVTPRIEATVLLLRDGRVLVSGGLESPEGGQVLSAELFDPVTNAFAPSGWDGAWRFEATTVQLDDGRVLQAGGCILVGDPSSSSCEASAELATIDPATGGWTDAGLMSRTRTSVGALKLIDGRVLLFNNGWRPDIQLFGRHRVDPISVDIFDPRSNSVSTGAPLPHAVSVAVPLGDGRVFLAGEWSLLRTLASVPPMGVSSEGSSSEYIDDCWIGIYDPRTGEAITSPDPLGGGSSLISDTDAQHASAVVLANDHVVLVTGRDIEVFR